MKKIAIFIIFALTVVTCTAVYAQNALVDQKCSKCHSTDRVYNKKANQATWDATFARMVKLGLKVTPEEEKELKAFLYTLK